MGVKLPRLCTCATNTTLELSKILNAPRVLALETGFSSLINKPRSGCRSKSHLADCNLCILGDYSLKQSSQLARLLIHTLSYGFDDLNYKSCVDYFGVLRI